MISNGRLFIFIYLFFLASKTTWCQDTLILKNGIEIYGKVVEITDQSLSLKEITTDSTRSYIHLVPLHDVFMIFYRNGKRETVFNNDNQQQKQTFENKESSAESHVGLTSGLYQIELMRSEVIKDKKDRAKIVSCVVKVLYNSNLFDSLGVYIYQSKEPVQDFSSPRNAYLSKNYMTITTSSSRLSYILFQKYENVLGKGYGWAIPPDFFSKENNLKNCEIAFLEQKSGNKEVLGFGGISFKKYPLIDCTTVEKRILSAALNWIEVNFGRK